MRSIPALYNGQPFSSRLECRWATWWDLLGIPWSYEPEVLLLEGEPPITYVPDFWLPTMKAWVEIKGEVIDDTAGLLIIEKCRRLALQSASPVILCFEQPYDPKCAVFYKSTLYSNCRWTYCQNCGALAIGIRTDGGSTIRCPRAKEHGAAGLSLSESKERRQFLTTAALAARSARFGWPRKKSA
jgi:hypothetical protein